MPPSALESRLTQEPVEAQPMSSLEAFRQRKAPLLEAFRAQEAQAMDEANSPIPVSREQALYTTALAILPVIAGLAIRGRHGGALGAKAGALGLTGFFKNQREDEDTVQKLALARARLYGQDRRAIENAMLRSENKEAEYQYKLQHPGLQNRTNITIHGPEGPLPKEERKIIQTAMGTAAKAQQAFSEIMGVENFQKFQKEGYLSPDGTFSMDKTSDVIKERLKGWAGNLSTDMGQINRSLDSFVNDYLYLKTGKAATIPEIKRLRSMIVGSGLSPATVPQMMENISKIVEGERAAALSAVEVLNLSDRPGGRNVEALGNLFNTLTPSLSRHYQPSTPTPASPTPMPVPTPGNLVPNEREQKLLDTLGVE